MTLELSGNGNGVSAMIPNETLPYNFVPPSEQPFTKILLAHQTNNGVFLSK